MQHHLAGGGGHGIEPGLGAVAPAGVELVHGGVVDLAPAPRPGSGVAPQDRPVQGVRARGHCLGLQGSLAAGGPPGVGALRDPEDVVLDPDLQREVDLGGVVVGPHVQAAPSVSARLPHRAPRRVPIGQRAALELDGGGGLLLPSVPLGVDGARTLQRARRPAQPADPAAQRLDDDRFPGRGDESGAALGEGDGGGGEVPGGDHGEGEAALLLGQADPDGRGQQGGVGVGRIRAGVVVAEDLLPRVALTGHAVGAVLAQAHHMAPAPSFEREGHVGGGGLDAGEQRGGEQGGRHQDASAWHRRSRARQRHASIPHEVSIGPGRVPLERPAGVPPGARASGEGGEQCGQGQAGGG